MSERTGLTRREILGQGLRSGVGLTAALSLSVAGSGAAEAAAAKKRPAPIPPNCIYVCCDGTCDSWKMCLKCFDLPKKAAVMTR